MDAFIYMDRILSFPLSLPILFKVMKVIHYYLLMTNETAEALGGELTSISCCKIYSVDTPSYLDLSRNCMWSRRNRKVKMGRSLQSRVLPRGYAFKIQTSSANERQEVFPKQKVKFNWGIKLKCFQLKVNPVLLGVFPGVRIGSEKALSLLSYAVN